MSTRSNIYLKLKDESKGQTIKFDFSKLPTAHGEQHAKLEFPIKDVTIPQDAEYIGVFHHWDGYITGVGKTLLESYTDYDTILNLLIMGDLSSINGGVTSYQGWRNEDCPARIITPKTNGVLDSQNALREEYAYLFDGEKWRVAYNRYSEKTNNNVHCGWLDLKSEFKREKAEIEEQEKARTNTQKKVKNMSFLSMSVEPIAGAYLPDVLEEMQVLGNMYKCKVKTIFNGDEYVVTPK